MTWAASLAAGIAVSLFLAVTLFTCQAVRPARFAIRKTPADDGLRFDTIRFPSRDGTPLAGWWVAAADARATIILCHGYPSNRSDVRPLIPFLHAAGYNVLAFDFRRLGESGGRVCTIGLNEPKDLLGAVDEAAHRSGRPIGALGMSMGAAVALMSAAEEPRIRAVVADSAYASLDRMCRRRWSALPGVLSRPAGSYSNWLGARLVGRSLSGASPFRAVAAIAPRPILFIHARRDALIPCSDSEELFHAAPGPKDLWITSASGHVRSWSEETDEYQRRVLAFFEGSLSPQRHKDTKNNS
ncbi:MAG TPA: alpha/beta hydrolase [Armatimonadota bacterium]